MPDQFATVRDNPIVAGRIDYLGVVGSKYEPVQNEASCTLLDALTEEGGAVYETAGALRGGRETFVTMKLPTSMTFEGRDGSKDRTDWYLAALNSHDGYLPLAKPVGICGSKVLCGHTVPLSALCQLRPLRSTDRSVSPPNARSPPPTARRLSSSSTTPSPFTPSPANTLRHCASGTGR